MKKCRLTLHLSPRYKRWRAGRYRWISSTSNRHSRLAVHAKTKSPRMKRWSRSTPSSHNACTWYTKSASKWLSRNLSVVRGTFSAQNAWREFPKWRLERYLEILSLRRWTKLRNPNCWVRTKTLSPVVAGQSWKWSKVKLITRSRMMQASQLLNRLRNTWADTGYDAKHVRRTSAASARQSHITLGRLVKSSRNTKRQASADTVSPSSNKLLLQLSQHLGEYAEIKLALN